MFNFECDNFTFITAVFTLIKFEVSPYSTLRFVTRIPPFQYLLLVVLIFILFNIHTSIPTTYKVYLIKGTKFLILLNSFDDYF